MERVASRLATRFDGNPHWYGETVKLDLEARNVIERTVERLQKYRRVRSRSPARRS
jgi:hypothetical protein